MDVSHSPAEAWCWTSRRCQHMASWQDVMKWVRVAVATRCSSVVLYSASEAHQPVIIQSINAVDPLDTGDCSQWWSSSVTCLKAR